MSENWNKSYSRINWKNYPNEETPINETNLNLMDSSLNVVDNRVLTLDTIKLDLDTANTMVKDVTLNSSTGVITITFLNGTTRTYDTKLEKLAVNFSYDSQNQRLVITLDDGTKQYVDLSSLITEYEFTDTSTIDFSVSNGSVSAIVKDGSITGSKLQPDYLADIQELSQQVSIDASTASTSATKAHQWATYGSDTEQPSATNNAKYWAQQSRETFDKTDVYKVMGYNGAKNLLAYPYYQTTRTTSGITFTDNGDGSITVNGTATAECYFFLHTRSEGEFNDFILPNGDYILSGCPIDGTSTTYFLLATITKDSQAFNLGYDVGEGASFTVEGDDYSEDGVNLQVAIVVRNGVTVDNLTFKPMIRRNEDTDSTWQPYTLTNKELTANKANASNIAQIEDGETASATYNVGSFIVRKGLLYRVTTTIAQGSVISEGVNITLTNVGAQLSQRSPNYKVMLTIPANTYTNLGNALQAIYNTWSNFTGLQKATSIIMIGNALYHCDNSSSGLFHFHRVGTNYLQTYEINLNNKTVMHTTVGASTATQTDDTSNAQSSITNLLAFSE